MRGNPGATRTALRSSGLLRRFASRNDGAGRERRGFLAMERMFRGPSVRALRRAAGTMHSLKRAIGIAVILFGASVVGMLLQWVVPADVLTASKGTVGAMVGLVTLLLALVLGLLVFTAFSVFTTQRDEAYSLGPLVAEADLALELYGPEAAGGRAGLRAALQRSRVRFFGDAERGPQPFTFEEMRAIFLSQNSFFDRLKPATDAQRALAATAKDQVRKLADTQMLMARQLASPFPPHVLNVVVCWAAALFLGNGLVAAPNAVSVLAHF